MERARIAEELEEFATLLALKGENPFKVRAFENAARTVAGLPDFDAVVARGAIGSVKGIGKAIAEVVTELVATGRSREKDDLRSEFPDGLFELLRVPGLGPKKAVTLWKELGVASLGELEYAIRENRLATLSGFGEKTQRRLAEGIRFLATQAGRARLPEAFEEAARASRHLRERTPAAAGLSRIEVAGELRRHLETVSELVLVVACERPELLPPLPSDLAPLAARVVAVPAARFSNALLAETGSVEHLALLAARERAGALSEPAASEEEIYRRLGLPFVPPELREGRSEVALAAAGALPRLLEASEIRGAFHLHSTFSDGRATLEEIFRDAVARGFEYVGLSDHSPAAAYAGGLSKEKVLAQWAEIERLAPRFPSLRVFRGTEADILPDGSIDYGDDFLAGFDFVIASVHSSFHLPREEQTRRLVRAVTNPRVTMLGHATGRLLLARKGFDVDLEAVLDAAGEAGCGVEINASPYRLDLDWRLGEAARRAGVFTSINPDAHDLDGLDDVRFGVGIARKAGYGPSGVLNTGSAADVALELARLRTRADHPAAAGGARG